MATKKGRIKYLVDAQNTTNEFLPATIAGIVSINDTAGKYEATDVEGALEEIAEKLEDGLASAGKVDDVQAVDGTSIVENKIAKLSKKAVGLDKVDNTADSEKSVAEAVRVSSKLTVGNSGKTVEFDGAMPIKVEFKDEDFTATQTTTGISIGAKDKGYATKTELENGLNGKLDKTGGVISGGLTVQGNLTVSGKTTTVESETLEVADKLITVAKNNTAPLTSPAGIVAPKYDGTNSGALVFDADGTAYVGDVTLVDGEIDTTASDLQPIATRSALIDDTLVKWNSTDQTLVPDQRQYAQKTEDETITGAWDFSNQNGIKTNAIENRNGNRVFEYSSDRNTFGSQAKPTDFRGSEEHLRYTSNGSTYRQLAFVDEIAGTTVNTAKNVSETINNQKITDIFETDGKTVKKATNADNATRANVATRAENVDVANVANRVANKVRFSGHNGNGTEQTLDFDGSANKEIAFNENDLNVSLDNGTMVVDLEETGVLNGYTDASGNPASTGTFTALMVDRKGRAVSGGQAFAFINEGDAIPSNLMIGGLIFEIIE